MSHWVSRVGGSVCPLKLHLSMIEIILTYFISTMICSKWQLIKQIITPILLSSYGKSKLFCHYFNKEKDCPFEGRCIFAHEESPECRFGQTCERVMCMFSHDERDVSDTESDNENDEEDIDENDDDTEMFKITDIEPSLQKVEDAMEKVQ